MVMRYRIDENEPNTSTEHNPTLESINFLSLTYICAKFIQYSNYTADPFILYMLLISNLPRGDRHCIVCNDDRCFCLLMIPLTLNLTYSKTTR